MKAFVDSNLLPRVIFPSNKNVNDRRLAKVLFKNYDVVHNVISLVESARNYRLSDFKRRKLHQLIGRLRKMPRNLLVLVLNQK